MYTPGERMALCRTEKGWSQRTLAEKIVRKKLDSNVGDPVFDKRLKATQTKISAWENGLYEPSVKSAKVLGEIFGITVEWLLTGKLSAEHHKTTLPLIEPLVFREIETDDYIEQPYYPKDALEAGMPVSVPERLSEKADFLIKAPSNSMSFDGIWEGDYVAISQYQGPERDDGQAELIEIGTDRIFLVFVWKQGEPFAHYLARVRHIEGASGIFLVFNSFDTFPVEFSKSGDYITAIIGEVRGWIHFENPDKQQPAVWNASALTKRAGTGVPPRTS